MGRERIEAVIERKGGRILSVFYTAGFPSLSDTVSIAVELQANGVDLIELGFPYSDSLVDGPTIQAANERALQNGMTLSKYFEQARQIREQTELPIVFMGCINPLLQFGVERFLDACVESGIDGLIIPDLPPEEYEREYRAEFERRDLAMVLLLTGRTSEERVRYYDQLSNGFLYAVSSESTTGNRLNMDQAREAYFTWLKELQLRNPVLIGFGISDARTFDDACRTAPGAVIGSAFLRALQENADLKTNIRNFVNGVRASQHREEVK